LIDLVFSPSHETAVESHGSTAFFLRFQMFRCRCFAVAFLVSAIMAGCGSDDGRSRLSGKATFGGQPIVYGEIVFHPQAGPEGSATIRNGLYDTSLESGQGIARGPNTLVVTAYAAEPVASSDETVTTDAEPPLFIGHQLQADLTSDTFDIDVPTDAVKSPAKRK
jgi:hypothetical protein